MKRAVALLVLGLLALSLLAAAGCGEKKTTITTPEGNVTVEEGEGGKVTVQGEGGEVAYEWSGKAPTEEQLGVPIYPGAQYVPESGGSGSFSDDKGATSIVAADFTTTDSFDKVLAWYTGKLGQPLYVEEGKEATWMSGMGMDGSGFKAEEGEIITLAIKAGSGKVTISAGRMAGAGI
jgi:hypothetical protein